MPSGTPYHRLVARAQGGVHLIGLDVRTFSCEWHPPPLATFPERPRRLISKSGGAARRYEYTGGQYGWPVRFLGGFLFSLLTGRQTNFDWNVGSFIVAVIGALVLLFISTPDAADLIPHEPVRARPDTERRGKGP